MESISSLNRVPATPRDLKPEAASKLSRDPQDEAARKRNRRGKPGDPDDDFENGEFENGEFEIDTFEHVDSEPPTR